MSANKKMLSDNHNNPPLSKHYIQDHLDRGGRMYDWHPLDDIAENTQFSESSEIGKNRDKE